jgi:heptaprenyl diphosphate synthase
MNIESTPLPDEKSLQYEARVAGLIVVGLLLFVFEAYLPRPIPWLKLGLANIATIIALYWLGWRAALTVSIFRILIGSFFTGNLFTPGFFLSVSGGLLAVSAMCVFFSPRIFGVITISVIGALFHNLGQLLIAVYFLFKNPIIWYLLPVLFLAGLLTGIAIGFISFYLLKRMPGDFKDESIQNAVSAKVD